MILILVDKVQIPSTLALSKVSDGLKMKMRDL